MTLRGSCTFFALAFAGVLASCGSDDPTLPEGSGKTDGGASPAPDGGQLLGADGSTPPDEGGAAVDAALGPDHTGQATYYDADGTGACGFKASTDLAVTAVNGTDYKKADCGKCLEVTGPKGTTVVRIVDLCPGCKKGDLDLSRSSFTKIATLSAGRVAITWHFVACP